MDKSNKAASTAIKRGLLQAAFFLSGADFSDKLDIATKIKASTNNTFDGDPVILPIPDDAPAEFPRIALSSKNKVYICNVSPLRVDFLIDVSKVEGGIRGRDIEELFLRLSGQISKIILDQLNWGINRLALISQSKIEFKERGASFLQQMVNDKFGEDSKELQLHRLKTLQIGEFDSNHWTRIISEKNSLIVLSDLNTSQYQKYDMNIEKTEIFFMSALKITEEALESII